MPQGKKAEYCDLPFILKLFCWLKFIGNSLLIGGIRVATLSPIWFRAAPATLTFHSIKQRTQLCSYLMPVLCRAVVFWSS